MWFIEALNAILLQRFDFQFHWRMRNRFSNWLLVSFLFQGETILIEFRQEYESMFGHFLCFVFGFFLFLDPFEHGISYAIVDVLWCSDIKNQNLWLWGWMFLVSFAWNLQLATDFILHIDCCVHFFFRRINACVLISFSHFNAIYSIHGRLRETTKATKETRFGVNSHFTVCLFFTSSFPFHVDLISISNFVYILLDGSVRFECAEQSIEIYIIWHTIASTRPTKLNFEHNLASRYWLRQYPIGRKKSAKLRTPNANKLMKKKTRKKKNENWKTEEFCV